jgi:DegV family protein with EDD domain
MKIRYINGRRLYYAFLAGGNAVISDQDYLNKINVFPVPDADTGTNLAATMRSIAETAVVSSSLKKTFRSIADAALAGARGNSGLIFAQFVHSLSNEIQNDHRITARNFAESSKRAVQAVYRAILSPVEGTMLTVMRDWAEAINQRAAGTGDFADLLAHSLQAARKSLMNTPKKLSALAKAGVVDAGAKGFVDFIEGVFHFTRAGKLRNIPRSVPLAPEIENKVHSFKNKITYRYCAEALLQGERMDLNKIRDLVGSFGDSAIVAGSAEKVRFHVHTNAPADLFFNLKDFGSFVQLKVDDMRQQYEVSHNRKRDVGLVVDSSCDLPSEFIDEHQIQVIPFTLSFGGTQFLDKLTITPEQFYTLLRTRREHPTTALPGLSLWQNLYSYLSTFYESILSFSISGGLSGAYATSRQAAEKFGDKKITVIDSKHLSVSMGLIVMRAAESLNAGMTHDEIVREAAGWIKKTRLLVDIATLKYMVRGGRVSPMKGLIGRMLNLKPIISLDRDGKAVASGKSFSRRGNMKRILRLVEEIGAREKIWRYAVVHAQNSSRAAEYAGKLTVLLGKPPAYVMNVSPVVGAHNGIGVIGIAVMSE